MITPEQLARMERLEPGVYADSDGAMHLVADELLEAHGFAATAENIDRLESTLQEVASAYGIREVERLDRD